MSGYQVSLACVLFDKTKTQTSGARTSLAGQANDTSPASQPHNHCVHVETDFQNKTPSLLSYAR